MNKNIQNLISTLEKIDNFDYLNNIEVILNKILARLKNGGIIYLAGNGGSAAQSQHFAAELVGRFKRDRKPINAISLTTDTSIITSIGNDISFDNIFMRQIESKFKKNDILICFSTSGNSKNISNLLKFTKKNDFYSILLSGKSGGKCKNFCSDIIKVPTNDTAIIQEAHLLITHYMCEKIENYYA